MKSKLLSWMSRMLAAVVALFSVGGCKSAGKVSQDDPGDEPVCVYGIPTSYYKVHGMVTDKNKKPIEGIEVEVSVSEKKNSDDADTPLDKYEYGYIFGEPASTNPNGEYQFSGMREFGNEVIKVKFTDPNGKFKSDSVFTKTPTVAAPGTWESNYEYEINATLKPTNSKKKK